MSPKCAAEIIAAVGRPLSDADLRKIENDLANQMRVLARRDPAAWRALSDAERGAEAGKAAAEALLAEAAKKAQRNVAAMQAAGRLQAEQQTYQAHGMTPTRAVGRTLENVDTYVKGVVREAVADMGDAIDAMEPRFLGLVHDAKAMSDFVQEVFGKKTGNEVAAKGAKAWLETIEQMRTRFNAAGGEIGRLAYGYIPQPHDQARILKAGDPAWVAKTFPLLRRDRYLREDGRLMDDSEIIGMLKEAYATLSTGGLNKMEPGEFQGDMARAKRGSQHREIHFKDADSYMAYMDEFGQGTVYDAMIGHVTALSRDIGLVERMGPNPDASFHLLNDQAIIEDGGVKHFGPFYAVTAENLWKTISGHTSQTINPLLGAIGTGVREWTVAAKLQGTLLSAVTDVPTLFLTARYHNLPFWETLGTTLKAFGAESAEYANRTGMATDSVIGDLNRWAEGNLGHRWTSKLANATMKVSLLDAWTNGLKRGFSTMLMGGLGKMSRTDWAALDATDRARLELKGITEADFKVWQQAKPEQRGASQMLTPESIRAIEGIDDAAKNAAVSKLLGYIADEADFAVLSPDALTRTALTQGTQKGTVSGEFLRTLTMFKSFPLAMVSRHMNRIAEIGSMEGGARGALYAVALMAGLTTFGALSLQLKDIIMGKDPRDMSKLKFLGAAFVQGGGMGIYGDVLYTGVGGNSRNGTPNWVGFAGGPVFGSLIEAADLTLGNIGQAARGERTNAPAEALRFASSNLPFLRLWYARGAIDHLLLHEAQEYLSPGYLSRMQATARKDWGQDYWARPGANLPDRMPNIGAAFGQ